MGVGRKNAKRASHKEGEFSLEDNQSIMQVVSLRGSNIIEVIDAEGVTSLAMFPAKFQKSLWIKRGSFVVVDGNARKEALDSGSKVACLVSQVLFHDQVRVLRKSSHWPEAFKGILESNLSGHSGQDSETIDESEGEGDDSLPPLEENLNRVRPSEFRSDSDSESDSNTGQENSA
ncbi:uncharacterized protein LOC144700968 [Wolffia australiana]